MKAKFFRKLHIIRTINDDGSFNDEICRSINAAKRRSRELQSKNGGLGAGSLKVVEKLPEPVKKEESQNV